MAEIDKTCLERVISAALAVYRTADSLPSADPLAQAIKKAALQTTEKFVVFLSLGEPREKHAAAHALEVLCGYFAIAQTQKWIDERNFNILTQEYRDLYAQIALIQANLSPQKEKAIESKKPAKLPPTQVSPTPLAMNERQRKILEYMAGNQESPFTPIAALFSQVSKRTVRRDLDSLVRGKILARQGNTNSSLYRLIRTA